MEYTVFELSRGRIDILSLLPGSLIGEKGNKCSQSKKQKRNRHFALLTFDRPRTKKQKQGIDERFILDS